MPVDRARNTAAPSTFPSRFNSAEVFSPDDARVNRDVEHRLTFVGNEEGRERLDVGVPVDEEAELGEDGEPHVVGLEPWVQVLLPGAYDGVGKAILLGHSGKGGGRARGTGIVPGAERRAYDGVGVVAGRDLAE